MKNSFTILSLVTVLSLLIVGDALFAWGVPNAVPPSSNVAAPINTSSVSQTKQGLLGVGELITNAAMVNRADTPNGAILGVNGNVAASAYCDVDGLNCIQPGNPAVLPPPQPGEVRGAYTMSKSAQTSLVCSQVNPITGSCSCQAGYSAFGTTVGTGGESVDKTMRAVTVCVKN